jgi:hypothetical protein
VVIAVKKGDLLIIFILICAGLTWYLQDYFRPDSGNNLAVIEVNGKHYQSVPMNENAKYLINFPDNKYIEVTIENQEAWISKLTVDCPEKICIKTGKISKPGESIVCLPNKTVIYIEGSANKNIDDISF